MELMETLLLPFQFAFMQRAFIITLMVAIPAGLLSCFLVLKGWSLMGDAISHAVLPGVVLAYIVNLPFAIGAFAAGMICAIATGYLSENSRVKEDTVMGIVFAGMFGLGTVIYLWTPTNVHLDHILFGSMLGVTLGDILQTGVISLVASAVLVLKLRDLLLFAFDPVQARAIGLRVGLLHYGLLAILSLVIVAALKAVGIILAVAILIAPGAIAFLISRDFTRMLIAAVAVAVIGSFLGIYAAFFIDSDPAATIVMVLTLLFIITFVRATWRASHDRARSAARAMDAPGPRLPRRI